MHHIPRHIFLTFLAVILFCVFSENVFAQSASKTFAKDYEYIEHYWGMSSMDFPNPKMVYSYQRKMKVLDKNTKTISHGCYWRTVSPIQTTPPIDSRMSVSVKTAYHITDSLWRHKHNDPFGASHIKNVYMMEDHDYLLYKQYSSYSLYIDSSYDKNRGSLATSIPWMKDTLRLSASGRLKYMLLTSAGVYRIRIVSIEDGSDSADILWSRPEKIMCITAVPLDTLKGQAFYSDCSAGGKPCLQFVVYPYASCFDTYLYPKMNRADKRYYDNRDNAILRNYTDFSWQPGNEYIVFLDAQFQMDTTKDHFRYKPLQGDPQGGIYPIVNGMVQDDANYFGMGASVPVEDFEKKIRETISSILQ